MTKLFSDVHTAVMSDKQISENVLVKNMFENFAVRYPSITESNIEKAMTDLGSGLSGINEYLKSETITTQMKAISDEKSKLRVNMPGAVIAKMYEEFNLAAELESMKEAKAYSNPAMKTYVDGLLYSMKFKNLPSMVYLPSYVKAMEAFIYDDKVKESVDKVNLYIQNNRKKLIMLETIYKLDLVSGGFYKSVTESLKRLVADGEMRSANIKTKLGASAENTAMVREMLSNLRTLEATAMNNTFGIIEGNSGVKVYEYMGPVLKTEDSIITLIGNSFVEITEASEEEFLQMGEEPEFENEPERGPDLDDKPAGDSGIEVIGDMSGDAHVDDLPGDGETVMDLINKPEGPIGDITGVETGCEPNCDGKRKVIKIRISIPESKYSKRIEPINGYAVGFLKNEYMKENHPEFVELVKNYAGMGFVRNNEGATAKLGKISISFKLDETGKMFAYLNNKKIEDMADMNVDDMFVMENLETKKSALNVFKNLGSIMCVDFLKTFVAEGKTASVINLEGKYIVYSQVEENKSNLYMFDNVQLYTFIKESFKYDMRDVFSVSISEAESKWKALDAKRSSILEQISEGENSLVTLDKTAKELAGDNVSLEKLNTLRDKISGKITELKNNYILTENEMALLEDDGKKDLDGQNKTAIGDDVVTADGKQGIVAGNNDAGQVPVLDKGTNLVSNQPADQLKKPGEEAAIPNSTVAPDASNDPQAAKDDQANQEEATHPNSTGDVRGQATNNPAGSVENTQSSNMPGAKFESVDLKKKYEPSKIDEVETPYYVDNDYKAKEASRKKQLGYLRGIVKEYDKTIKPSKLDNDIKLNGDDEELFIEIGQLFKNDLDAIRDAKDEELTDEYLGDAYQRIQTFMDKFGTSESLKLVLEAESGTKEKFAKMAADKAAKKDEPKDDKKKDAPKKDEPKKAEAPKKTDAPKAKGSVDFDQSGKEKVKGADTEFIQVSKQEWAEMMKKAFTEEMPKLETAVDVITKGAAKGLTNIGSNDKITIRVTEEDMKNSPEFQKLYASMEDVYIRLKGKNEEMRKEMDPILDKLGLKTVSDSLKDRTAHIGKYTLQLLAVKNHLDPKEVAKMIKPQLQQLVKEGTMLAKQSMEMSVVTDERAAQIVELATKYGTTTTNIVNWFRKSEAVYAELYAMEELNEEESNNSFTDFLHKIGSGSAKLMRDVWSVLKKMIDATKRILNGQKALEAESKTTDSMIEKFLAGPQVAAPAEPAAPAAPAQSTPAEPAAPAETAAPAQPVA